MKIRLKSGIEIGDDCPPFIIAEVGSNWTNLEDCLHSIRQAKLAGADAVKFQLYNSEALYGSNLTDPQGSLPREWLPALKDQADKVGIEFMCSAFSPELIEAVDPYVNIHKVASSEMCHIRMLEKLREIGKPVILSTGAQHVEDIACARMTLGAGVSVILMYCEAAYPARVVHFGKLHDLKRFGTLVGYSDHSTDALVVPVASTAYGACVIEKHVTFIGAQTPDSPHSLTQDEFTAMIQQFKGGVTGKIGPSEQEKDMITKHKRRLIATRTIEIGDKLVEGDNFGIYRSLKDETHAFMPFMVNEVNGRLAKKRITAGDGIGPGDI